MTARTSSPEKIGIPTAAFSPASSGRLVAGKIPVERYIFDPGRLLRFPDAPGKSDTRDEASVLGIGSELSQIARAAAPGWPANKVSALGVRDPGLSQRPACLLANAAQHHLQGGRDIARRRHFYRDGLEQAELLFARSRHVLSRWPVFGPLLSGVLTHFACMASALRTAARN